MGSIDGAQPNAASRYTVKQATTKQQMNQIMDVIWAANHTPYEPFIQLFFPVLGFLPSDRRAAIADSMERFWDNHLSASASHWYYVEEVATNKVVGCAQWEVFLKNPFPDGPPKLRAPWWPEGEYREFCELILNQVYKPRASWMTRPHLALNWLAVLPTHRRLGIGTLLLQVGTTLADKLNLEAWMEASAMGKLLYENHCFRSLFRIAFDTEKKDASDVWRKCEHEMTPQPVSMMWRPKGGLWKVEGGVSLKMPWELGAEVETVENDGASAD